jgi:signal transduction histidine kinase
VNKKEPTDINALADEFFRLAYHGLKAKDKAFNSKMESNFDPLIGNINIVPQEIGRVLLNLINNAFYTVNEKKRQMEGGYEPTVSIITKKTGHRIEIRVRDNGYGIPDSIKEKIFQPFFTTKPAGLGTGLGLSLAYDIITKGHGGELTLKTEMSAGTEFIIKIPIN